VWWAVSGGMCEASLRPGLLLFSPPCDDDDEDVRMGVHEAEWQKDVVTVSQGERAIVPAEEVFVQHGEVSQAPSPASSAGG